MSIFRGFLFISLLLAVSAGAGEISQILEIPVPVGMHLAGSEDPTSSKVYIVQLKTPSAAEFHSSTIIQGAAARSTLTQRQAIAAFDKNSATIVGHANRLAIEQDEVLASIGAVQQKIYSYRYSLNGFAARMTPVQADKLRNDKRVLRVWEDELRPLATRSSPSFLGLFADEIGLRGAPGLDGEGVVIGVIDSGITPGHAALQDTRSADRPGLCRSSWAQSSLLGQWLCRKFEVREDVLDFEPPENWNGAAGVLQRRMTRCNVAVDHANDAASYCIIPLTDW